MQHQWVSLGLLCVGACNPHNVYTHRCHGRRRRRRSTTRFSCLHTHIIHMHMHTCRAIGSTVRFRCSSVFETVISVSRVASTEQHSGLSVCSQSTNKKLHLSHFGRHFVDWRCHQNIPQQRNSCSLLRISKFIFRTVSNIPSTSVVAVDIYNARTQKVQIVVVGAVLRIGFIFARFLFAGHRSINGQNIQLHIEASESVWKIVRIVVFVSRKNGWLGK